MAGVGSELAVMHGINVTRLAQAGKPSLGKLIRVF